MKKNIELLDCTLRDGAYIVDSVFGTPAIKGIIKKMQDANVDIIECGWLKDSEHKEGTSFYHMPSDMEQYLIEKNENSVYVVMIDWDRYDVEALPDYDGKSIDAIRVVFPHGKHKEGIKVGNRIKEKGYKVFFQAANTLAYSDEELKELATDINAAKPVSLSIVDTFGAMYEEDLDRIVDILDGYLDEDIKLGFHSHNNQQLSFALTIHFINATKEKNRLAIVDSTLCGMGRGAGNTTTELIASYLNRKHSTNYDMDVILDAIDMYMEYFKENYSWGYSTPYFIAGLYCTHVNNIAYMLKNHRANAKDIRNVLASMDASDRRKYDYDLLEKKFMENQDRKIDDEDAITKLRQEFKNREVLLLAPGKSVLDDIDEIKAYIEEKKPVVIGVNAIIDSYDYDYIFMVNSIRYNYANEVYNERFKNVKKLVLSNIKTSTEDDNEILINFNRVIKRGWEHYDNAVINALRLMDKLHVKDISLAGFDGFKTKYNESYADEALPTLNPDNKWDELNEEIKEMFIDFKNTTKHNVNVKFLTDSYFNV